MIDFNNVDGNDRRKRDFPALKSIAAAHAHEILSRWLPGGKVVGREYVCGNMKGGNGNSCSTRVESGVGGDFASTEVWGDYIDLVAKVEGIPQSDAYDRLEEFLGTQPYRPPVVIEDTQEERAANGRRIAHDLWSSAGPASSAHPYLTRKGIRAASELRVGQDGALLVPLYGPDGELRSIQRIYPDGKKMAIKDGVTKGSFHVIDGDAAKRVYIAEGYATAASVHEATGGMVVFAISASNLADVAPHFAEMFPRADLVIAADNDDPGRQGAQAAVKAAGRGRIIHPPKVKDWNDHLLEHGPKAVHDLLTAAPEAVLKDITTIPMTDPEFLVEDAVETPCTGTIIGASGAGKSFVALDLAFHVATGRKWLGKQVRQGAVIYVAGEGRHAIPRRMRAWEKKHAHDVPRGTFYLAQKTVSFDDEGVASLVAEVDRLAEQVAPALVIIDTMARALPGEADENSAKDVGTFVRAIDAVRDRYRCVVLVVHHTGWSEGAQKRGRGSSAMKGAMDLELLLSEGVLEWSKTKDMEPHPPMSFRLEQVAYGDGKRDHSCVVAYDTTYDPKAAKLTKMQRDGLDAFDAACLKTGGASTNLDTWRDEFYQVHGGTQQANRQAFNRIKKDIIGLQLVEENDGRFYRKNRSAVDHQIEEAMFGHLIKTPK